MKYSEFSALIREDGLIPSRVIFSNNSDDIAFYEAVNMYAFDIVDMIDTADKIIQDEITNCENLTLLDIAIALLKISGDTRLKNVYQVMQKPMDIVRIRLSTSGDLIRNRRPSLLQVGETLRHAELRVLQETFYQIDELLKKRCYHDNLYELWL